MSNNLRTKRKAAKKELTKVLVMLVIRSVVISSLILLVTFLICTNPYVIAPLLMGDYLIAAIQFAGYIAVIFTVDALTVFSTIKESIKLLWASKNM